MCFYLDAIHETNKYCLVGLGPCKGKVFMYFERMVLMNINGNSEEKRKRLAKQIPVTGFYECIFSWIRSKEKNKNLDELCACGEICHFNTFWKVRKPLCWLPVLISVPSAPSSLKIVNPTLDSLTLEWDPPSHPNGILTEYTLRYQPSKLLGGGKGEIWSRKGKNFAGILKYKLVTSLEPT